MLKLCSTTTGNCKSHALIKTRCSTYPHCGNTIPIRIYIFGLMLYYNYTSTLHVCIMPSFLHKGGLVMFAPNCHETRSGICQSCTYNLKLFAQVLECAAASERHTPLISQKISLYPHWHHCWITHGHLTPHKDSTHCITAVYWPWCYLVIITMVMRDLFQNQDDSLCLRFIMIHGVSWIALQVLSSWPGV